MPLAAGLRGAPGHGATTAPVAAVPVAAALGAAAMAITFVAAIFLIRQGGVGTVVLAVVAVLMLMYSLAAGSRGSMMLGVVALAGAALAFTSGESLGFALAVNALVAMVCNATAVALDFSFDARRGLAVEPRAAHGYSVGYGVAVGGGILMAAAVVSVVLSLQWPDWLLLVAASLLAGAVALAFRWSLRASASAIESPQPPPPRVQDLDS